MALWNELQAVVEGERYSGLFAKIVNPIRDYRFSRKLRKVFGDVVEKPTVEDIISLIPIVQCKFYEVKQTELVSEIDALEKTLNNCDASAMMKQLQESGLYELHS